MYFCRVSRTEFSLFTGRPDMNEQRYRMSKKGRQEGCLSLIFKVSNRAYIHSLDDMILFLSNMSTGNVSEYVVILSYFPEPKES